MRCSCVFFLHVGRKDFTHWPKVLPPPHPPPCTLLARHELTIVPKRVKWFANWSTLIGGVVEDWQMASISFGHYWKATHSHLLYSLFIGPNWMALGQPAPSDNFVVIDQVAQNSLKSFWVTLFVLQNVQDVFIFFSRSQKNKDKITCESTPPSPNCIAFRSLRAKTQCMCVVFTARYWRRGEEGGGGGGMGGGLDFQERVWSLVSPLVKDQGDIASTKIVCMAQLISSDSEQLWKSLQFCHLGRLLRTPSIIEFPFAKSKMGRRLMDGGGGMRWLEGGECGGSVDGL